MMTWAAMGVIVAALGWMAYPDRAEVVGGATAVCNNGDYSMSESRRGTCSHQGGVKRWLDDQP